MINGRSLEKVLRRLSEYQDLLPEQELWIAVIVQAIQDQQSKGWMKGRDNIPSLPDFFAGKGFEAMCDYCGLSSDAVRKVADQYAEYMTGERVPNLS